MRANVFGLPNAVHLLGMFIQVNNSGPRAQRPG